MNLAPSGTSHDFFLFARETVSVAAASLARSQVPKIMVAIYGHYRSFAAADNVNTLVAREVNT
jgi:hypothetical protein